jgi:formylglycine-generating enzyme required for sulfatase activity
MMTSVQARIATIAVALSIATAPAVAQDFQFRGGPITPAAGMAQEGTGTSAFGYAGASLWLSDILQVQLNAGYDRAVTTEARLLVRPFTQPLTIEPYAYAGAGTQFGDEARRGSMPLGVGLAYEVSPETSVFFELGGRWIHRTDPDVRVNDLDFDFAPAVGVTYALGRRPRPSAVRAPRLADVPEARTTATGAEAPFPQTTSAETADQFVRRGYARHVDIEDLGARIRVPDGTFVMGLSDEDPLRLQTSGLKRITVSGFEIDKMEVSNRQYREFIESLPAEQRAMMQPDPGAWDRARSTSTYEAYFQSETFADHPVVAVTWQQALTYCENLDGRLPTEAEWEYAARSGQPGSIFPWPGFDTRAPDGSYLANFRPGRGMYAADGYAFTAPVDAFLQTPWGMHNVAGNVAEWVMDGYAPNFDALTDFNPYREEAPDGRRVVRGGSWASDEFFIGVGVRDAQDENEATIMTGFRCAYDLGRGPSVEVGDATN